MWCGKGEALRVRQFSLHGQQAERIGRSKISTLPPLEKFLRTPMLISDVRPMQVGRAYTKTASCGKEFMRHEALRVDLLTLLRSCGIKHWVVKITNMPKR